MWTDLTKTLALPWLGHLPWTSFQPVASVVSCDLGMPACLSEGSLRRSPDNCVTCPQPVNLVQLHPALLQAVTLLSSRADEEGFTRHLDVPTTLGSFASSDISGNVTGTWPRCPSAGLRCSTRQTAHPASGSNSWPCLGLCP